MDIAVVVNLRARRGSESVAASCRAALPDAHVLASRSLDEALDFAKDLRKSPPGLLLSAGGDGTAIALINALRAAGAVNDAGPTSGHAPGHAPGPTLGHTSGYPPRITPVAGAPTLPAIGVLPLGTGNGWARALGASQWRTTLADLGRAAKKDQPLPVRRFDLVEVFGTLAHFAGTGWDAEVIDDFHAQKTGPGLLPKSARAGLAGYLQGLFSRTIPRHLSSREQVEVELINTGDDALTVDDEGRVIPLVGGEHGKVLYRGPASVCAAGTSPEWGFGFRAFPFAGRVARRFNMRIYAAGALEATSRMGQLWRGEHPIPKMHSWLLTRCHASFSRPVPFQIGGDRLGHKTDVDYNLASEQVDLLDWRALRTS